MDILDILNWEIFSITNLRNNNNIKDSIVYLNEILCHRSYLVNDCLTDADMYVFASLSENNAFLSNDTLSHVTRYYRHLESIDEVQDFKEKKNIVPQSAIIPQSAVKKESNNGKSSSNVKFEEGGKFIGLADAEMGKVVVRFPPEASGFLHIGHAKAALINFHYKEHYKGELIMRFDDTNPAKESSEFEHAILEDIHKLGVQYDRLTYTSDHFDTLIQYCEQMLASGTAYVDNTDPETMKKERELCIESRCRSHTTVENMRMWEEMKAGSESGKQCCVRVRFDMTSKNGCMRDPTIYRCKAESHVRTGNKYKVYPTYDFACPIVDSIEGVTHSLRTSEYNDRNEQFYAILDLVTLRKPKIADYSRLSLQNTVLSKRKLTWIVANGFVDGWDDARMPTVRGILRHGLTVEGLKEFVIAQGFGRANVVMEWDKIWAFNKKVIDPVAPRFTALTAASKEGLVTVTVRDKGEPTFDQVSKHPKNESVGTKTVWYTKQVLVERSDVEDFVVGTNVTFINWGNLLIESVDKETGQVIARLNLEDRDFKKTLKVTWLPLGDNSDDRYKHTIPVSVVTYHELITKPILDKDDDFKTFVNHDSVKEECLIGDSELSTLRKGDIVQLQRKGYFICDEPYEEESPLTGRAYPLVLINIPEGNKKERVTTGLKQKAGEKPAQEVTKKDVKKDAKKDAKSNEDKTKEEDKTKVEKITKEETTKEKKVKKAEKPKKLKDESKKEAQAGDRIVIKQTRLGMEAKKEDDLSKWYTEIITKSKLLEYSDISGCYILLEESVNIWREIQKYFNSVIEGMGVKECIFPLFISEDCLKKEKDHIADFAPEVAWVTMGGDKKLDKPVAIRPTSETAIYPYFAKEIQSYQDLPLKYNQWVNVVRWEFKNPVPFLRTREFQWQEGHTAFANREDAVAEVYEILDLYADVYKNLLAIPVVKGRKTEKEKFAGADFTTTTEIYIPAAGRAIQGATSHHLGQNFSKMFEVKYDSRSGTQEYVYQNSWGLTTRTIGIMVMVHGDNKGLVLPPRVAKTQVVIVPCGVTVNSTEEEKKSLMDKCNEVKRRLLTVGCRVMADLVDYRSPGWKFNHWELKGVPIRIEIGPKDIAKDTVVLCYRYNGQKETVEDKDVEEIVTRKMEEIQEAMYEKAKKELDAHRTMAFTMKDLCQALDENMMITAPFCGDKLCEEHIKTMSARDAVVEEGAPSMGAKSLCCPLEQPLNLGHKCVNDECTNEPISFTMFGRSY